jgi:hypothetical protein
MSETAEGSPLRFVPGCARAMAGELNIAPPVDLNNGGKVVARLHSCGWPREIILLCLDEAVTYALAARRDRQKSRTGQ